MSNITDSEWHIMRLLWEEHPQKSSDLVDKLNKSQGWSPTTVRTFLARLIDKEVVAFKRSGRSYLYSPLVSEKECIQSEMQLALQRVYGGVLNKSIGHFQFWGDNDMDFIEIISESLEKNYVRISKKYKFDFTETIKVNVYASQSRFHSALGYLNAPLWVRGDVVWGMIHIAPKICFTEIDVSYVIVHLLMQLFLNELNSKLPYWLYQGVSAYESNWITKERLIMVVNEKLPLIDRHYIKRISYNQEKFKELAGYELCYTIIEFIEQTYGTEKLLDFIKRPELGSEIFEMRDDMFWDEWIKFLKNYGKG